jgi:Na+-transporting NADH:ubiquinone oxidoreductase subunit A
MSGVIKIKKGLNINLVGKSEKIYSQIGSPNYVSIKPSDFTYLTPKMQVKVGDEVLAGDIVFVDKDKPSTGVASPVSGEITEIIRGEKRKILEVKILAEKEIRYKDFGSASPSKMSQEEVLARLSESGALSFFVERPFGGTVDADVAPRDIFVTGFDSNPLAADFDFALHGKEELVKTALEAMAKLTEGTVYVGVSSKAGHGSIFEKSRGLEHVEFNTFQGQHPVGNVGVQIHATNPINKGETVWTMSAYDLAIVGGVFTNGKFDASRNVAVAGPGIKAPKYIKTIIGAPIKDIVSGNVHDDKEYRLVSGSPLTGTQVTPEGNLGYFDSQVVALEEGRSPKFVATEGWLSLGFKRFSASHAYPTWLLGRNKQYNIDTNVNGEHRSFVVSGQYEKVFPFNIYPVHLLKAILANDIEAQEALGIYEVLPEDFALCDFVCTSKIDAQVILADGLKSLKAELG